MSKKDPKSPATTSAAYDAMVPLWDKINTLLAGTDAMRAAGTTYLPRHPKESAKAYGERLGTSTLLNMLQFTLDTWTGKPFKAPVTRGPDIPPAIQPLLEDVDLQGNNLDVFARRWFREGLAKGFSHVLVEYPHVYRGQPDAPRTIADDNREGNRPYLVAISPESLIFAYAEVEAGQEVLKQVRIHETVCELQGFGEVEREQIRVLEPGKGYIYEQRKVKGKIVWVETQAYTYDLDFIPLVTFYADRQGFMCGKPPLSDLADLNIRHWQSTSDQIAVLTVSRFPILACSGSMSDDEITVGPNQWLNTPDPAARIYYVEHSGAAISAGRNDLVDLEEQMSQYGATFLRKRPGGASATAHAIDNAEVTSPLQDMAVRFRDSLEQAMLFFAKWMKLDHGGSYSVVTDFSLTDHDADSLVALQAARLAGDIGQEEFLNELKRLGVLSEDFDIASNMETTKKETADKAAAAQKVAEQQIKVKAATAPKPQPQNAGGTT